jgi:hypothetical protein
VALDGDAAVRMVVEADENQCSSSDLSGEKRCELAYACERQQWGQKEMHTAMG